MIKYIFFVLFVNFCFIHSQSAIIVDIETKSPLQDVNIFNHYIGTTSDANGRFNYDGIFSDNDTIMFSLIGYKPIHLVKKDISKVVEMTKTSIPLDLVNVYGGKQRFKKKYRKLERDVRKVYPYSIVFSNYLEKYENIMDTLNNFSGIKRYYEKEKYLVQLKMIY